MFHGMYEYRDEYGKTYSLNTRIGGHHSIDAAVRSVVKRGGNGYVSDYRNVVLHVVKDGKIMKVI